MPVLHKQTIDLLEDLERRLDAATEDDLAAQWEAFLRDRFDGDLFMPQRKTVSQPGVPLPDVHINDAISDLELMLRSQLKDAAWTLSTRTSIPCIRANYGTGILSSLFGAELYIMPRDMHTLPTTRQFGSTDKILALLDRGIPQLTGINMSQPELNDMERIYRCTVDKGIKLLGFSRDYAEKALCRPGGLRHQIHC